MIVIAMVDEFSWEFGLHYEPVRVVQFAHFSVQEFITSERVQIDSKRNVAQFRVFPGPAHTLLAHTCLSLLLFDGCIDKHVENSPLTTYAAMHWDAHACFAGEPLVIKSAMEDLFDVDKPYFARWVQQRRGVFQHDLTHPEQLKALSLRYSARSGLPQLTRHLYPLSTLYQCYCG